MVVYKKMLLAGKKKKKKKKIIRIASLTYKHTNTPTYIHTQECKPVESKGAWIELIISSL